MNQTPVKFSNLIQACICSNVSAASWWHNIQGNPFYLFSFVDLNFITVTCLSQLFPSPLWGLRQGLKDLCVIIMFLWRRFCSQDCCQRAPPYRSAPSLGSDHADPSAVHVGHVGDSPEFSDYVRAFSSSKVMYWCAGFAYSCWRYSADVTAS